MNLTSITDVRALLQTLDVRPNRTLGQSFLIDLNVLDRFVAAAELVPEDEVLEVGPGLGVLTERLLERVRRVVAVEKDGRLFAHLQRQFAGREALELIHADMLEVDAPTLFRSGVAKVVSNLPYSSGTRILLNCVKASPGPRQILATLQTEVVRRMDAPAGGKDYGLLSAAVQVLYDVEIVRKVSATCFWPPPEVGSSIVRLTRHARHPLTTRETDAFERLTRQAFAHRRKQMLAALSSAPAPARGARAECGALLEAAEIPLDARPERLTVEDWCRLARTAART